MRPQSPASSRLRPIRAAKETANRTAAWVKVGVTGAKTGAATSVGGMMNTFDECGEFWKWAASGDQSCRSARAMWPIPALMSVAGGPHGRPDASEPPAAESSIAAGAEWSTSQVCVTPYGTPAPRSRFQTAPRPGRFFSHAPCEAVCRLLVFTGRMAKPGTQLLQRREAVLDVLEG